ncbi:MAG: hypothetical protein ACJA2P_001457 [Rhodoferax sp.]|jgi:hypothetical protein
MDCYRLQARAANPNYGSAQTRDWTHLREVRLNPAAPKSQNKKAKNTTCAVTFL